MSRRYKFQLGVAGTILVLSLLLGSVGVAGAVWVACAALVVLFSLVLNLGPF